MAEDNKSEKTKKPIKTHWVELSGLFLIVFGIFLLLTFMFPAFAGTFGNFFRTSTRKYFGYIEYLLPLFFWIFGSKLIFPRHFSKFSHCFWSLFVIFIDLMLFFSLFGNNGGLVGETLVNLFRPHIGIAGTLTLAIFIAIAGFLYFFKISIKDFVINFYHLCVVTFKYIVKIALFSFKMLEKAFTEVVNLFNFLTKDTKIKNDMIHQDAVTETKACEIKEKGKEKIIEKEIIVGKPFDPDEHTSESKIENTEEDKKQTLKNGKIKYTLPPLSLLKGSEKVKPDKVAQDYAELLIKALESFGVGAKVTHIERGPTVTRYVLMPGEGVRVNKITSLANDIALVLAAQSIRIEAPIPGKSAIGIEVPNQRVDPVNLKDILESKNFKKDYMIPIGLAKDITGNPVVFELLNMPHLLAAGTTGSGKSVCINTIIASILFKRTPYEVQFLLIDPKRVGLIMYEDLPHLIETTLSTDQRIITDPKDATLVLRQLAEEMNSRYKKFSSIKVRNISEYNKYCLDRQIERIPYIVMVIDELAELMFVSSSSVENFICRLAQLGRASGIHLIIATQRPSVGVITGLIKANMPSRIALSVSSGIDSKIILDKTGAEKLLGKGDMLFKPIDAMDFKRMQGAYVDNEEIQGVVDFWKNQPEPTNKVILAQEVTTDTKNTHEENESGDDALFKDALQIIKTSGIASTSMLQRKLKIGYARAGRIMDMMEERGIVGPAEGSKPRKILMPIDN